MRVTNRGRRDWTIDGVRLAPGGSVNVSADSWRLALDLNKALRFAVGSEVHVEEEALPAVLTTPEPDTESVDEPTVEQPQPAPTPRGRRRR